MDDLTFRWDITLRGKTRATLEAAIDFILPITSSMKSIFVPKSHYLSSLPMISAKQFTYRRDIYVPIVTLYDSIRDLGLSTIVPFEIHKPSLSFTADAGNITVRFENLRLQSNKEAKIGICLVPHAGDWRPGLKYLLSKYPEYFSPQASNVDVEDGWYFQGRLYHTEEAIKDIAARGAQWIEFHYYFPFYGVYAPQVNDWSLIADSDDTPLSAWEKGLGKNRNSYHRMNRLIKIWQKYGVKVYLYLQIFEAWHQYAERYFSTEIARNTKGNPYAAFKFTNLMNPDPSTAWGEYILSQAYEILKKYPDINGIFYDRMDYCDFDFAHNDGITMADNKQTYMLGFAMERMNEKIFDLCHDRGKGVWGNGPTSIEVCKNLDGIMAETNVASLEKIKYMGIARPIIFLPYDRKPDHTETKLKHSLLCGAFPSITYGGTRCQQLDNKYQPLFDLIKNREWVLTPDPVDISSQYNYNMFKTPIGNYVLVIVSSDKSQLKPHPFEYNIPITVRVPNSADIEFAYLLSGDWTGINGMNIKKDEKSIKLILPFHCSSSLIYLTRKQEFELTRLSSPILVKGTTTVFEFNVTDYDENKPHQFELHSPWFKEKTPLKSDKITIKAKVPDNLEGEIELKAKYKGVEYILSSWILDPVSFVPANDIFLTHKSGENVSFMISNNLDKDVSLQFDRSISEGGTAVITPGKLRLRPLETRKIDLHVKSAAVDRVTLTMRAENKQILKPFTVRTGLYPAGDDLFNDDFTTGMRSWVTSQGEWTTSPTKGIASGKGKAHFAFMTNPEWGNYTIEVQVRCRGSMDPAIDWLKSYLFFRLQDERNFYRFGIHGDAGVIDLYKCTDGRWTLLQSTIFNAERNRWYALRVTANGSNIVGFVDGKKMIEIKDQTFSRGGIGIGVLENSMVCDYRSVVVKKL
jgi:hypothetical protein